ncbi:MlaD family protein [Nocardia goodfellowii]
MSRAAQFAVRGPSPVDLRLRGIAVILAIVLVAMGAWRVTQPSRDGEVSFGLLIANVGDGVGTDTSVRLRGMRIGSITGIESRGAYRQVVTLSVEASRLAELSTAMQARFVSANVFGSTALELIPKDGGSAIRPETVLDLGEQVSDFTVTEILRESGRALVDILTERLALSVDAAARLTGDMAPLLASALLLARSMQRTQQIPVQDLLPKLADVSEGVAAFTPSGLGILTALAAVEELDDQVATAQASATISEVSNLVFAFAGEVVGALGPMSSAVDMLLDMVIPFNQGMRDVTADQVRRLVAGADGALQPRDGRIVLQLETTIETVPAFRLPLQSTGGGLR